MILTCPECSIRYLIDPAVLGTDGRMVRCSKCENTWVQKPAENAGDTPEPGPEAAPDPIDAARERRARRAGRAGANVPAIRGERRSRAAAVMWTLLVVAIIGVLGAGFALRDMVIQVWPAAETLYQFAGLQPEPRGAGLGLRNVTWKSSSRDGQKVLTVEGEVINISKDVRRVPPIQGVLFDKSDRELQRWTFTAPESRLLPGENVTFRTELKNPTAGAARLTIVFANEK